MSNSLGSQTQSSSLTVNIKSAYDIGIPSPAPTAQGWTHIIIVSIVCGIMVIVMILVVCMMCKKVQRSSTQNPNQTSFSGGHGNKADHEFTTPFFGGQLAGQSNLNQYTTPDDHHRRTSATSEMGVVKIMDGGGGPAASLNPQLPKAAVDLQLRTIPDSSSERDSGTGDSQKSRDYCDQNGNCKCKRCVFAKKCTECSGCLQKKVVVTTPRSWWYSSGSQSQSPGRWDIYK